MACGNVLRAKMTGLLAYAYSTSPITDIQIFVVFKESEDGKVNEANYKSRQALPALPALQITAKRSLIILAPSQLRHSSVSSWHGDFANQRAYARQIVAKQHKSALKSLNGLTNVTNVTKLQILHRFDQIPSHSKALLPKVLTLQPRCFSNLEVCHGTSSENFLQLVACCFRLSWGVQGNESLGESFVEGRTVKDGPHFFRWLRMLRKFLNCQAWIAVADVVLWATAQHASDQGWLCNVWPFWSFSALSIYIWSTVQIVIF